MPGTRFPFCSLFKPTVLEGQLCYKLDLNRMSGKGKENELMLLLDYNEDLSLGIDSENNNKERTFNSTRLNLKTFLSQQHMKAKVQMNMITPEIGFGGGSYKMNAVKRMTARRDFLTMSFRDRNCNVEEYDDCRTRMLLQACNCVPWEMPGFQVAIDRSGLFCRHTLIFSGVEDLRSQRKGLH